MAVRPHRYASHLATSRPLDGFGILMHECDVPMCVRATTDPDTHVVEASTRANMLDRRRKGRDSNGSGFQWSGLAREHFFAQSRALRDEARAHGRARPERIAALIAGTDPDAPTLF